MNSSAAAIVPVGTAVLCLLLLIGKQAWCHPVDKPLSPALHDDDTFNDINDISKHAQSQMEDDGSVRLIPKVIHREHPNKENLEICCLHANILDFYLNNILLHRDDQHPNMPRLKTNLDRISRDLKAQGCNIAHYHNHRHASEFRSTFNQMGEKGVTKAVGEIDILFTYMQVFCIHSRKHVTTAAASSFSSSTAFSSSTDADAL
ncbi:uncharacterized protein LOC114465226 [Gouania willdenowi]|uniref:Uncharacterized LOC114465226 n=1 Tax=Gouania willdenowi TaxID=441366 RepID=A0A8C5D2I5_GOUWI|nr:uncharacterized protein LOC114465226 [Gouania willdenowi]